MAFFYFQEKANGYNVVILEVTAVSNVFAFISRQYIRNIPRFCAE